MYDFGKIVVDQRKLGQILVDQGMINHDQLEDALREQQRSGLFVGEILVARGVVSEEQVAKSLSEQLGYAYVDIREMSLEPRAVDAIPESLCRSTMSVPLFISQNILTVAMANALDVRAVEQIQTTCGMIVRPVFACPSSIRTAIDKHYGAAAPSKKTASGVVIKADESGPGASRPQSGDAVSSLKQAANLVSIIEQVNRLIQKAVEMSASDIHLEPEREQLGCRFRIDGLLHSMPSIKSEEQAAIVSRIKIMADMDIAEKRLPQDGRVRAIVGGREIDLRISTFPSIYGENVVIRILDRSGGLLRMTDLGFSKDIFEQFLKLIHRPYGIILVTGPTGSGKTTTLYAALNEINSMEKNIITLEDPVEYELPRIRQSQINVKAGLTFALGLRSIVRQDPDIIMIGEIRDKETADIAIHAALTGHLVFSTLHTNDAPSAATRLIDMGVEPFLVASSVIGIMAQRLIRTLCPSCKTAYEPQPELLRQLNISPKGKMTFYKETGCSKCKELGYSGRSGIHELMTPNERIKDLIAKKSPAPVIMEEAAKAGMKTLRDSGLEKVIAGSTSVSELLRVTEDI